MEGTCLEWNVDVIQPAAVFPILCIYLSIYLFVAILIHSSKFFHDFDPDKLELPHHQKYFDKLATLITDFKKPKVAESSYQILQWWPWVIYFLLFPFMFGKEAVYYYVMRNFENCFHVSKYPMEESLTTILH